MVHLCTAWTIRGFLAHAQYYARSHRLTGSCIVHVACAWTQRIAEPLLSLFDLHFTESFALTVQCPWNPFGCPSDLNLGLGFQGSCFIKKSRVVSAPSLILAQLSHPWKTFLCGFGYLFYLNGFYFGLFLSNYSRLFVIFY